MKSNTMHQSVNKNNQISAENKQGLPVALIVIAIIACLGLLSIFPIGLGDGALPAAEYHIRILSTEGQPIPGARMVVRTKNSNDEALGYPFDNYTAKNTLISDSQGHIIVQHFFRGFEFGGPVTLLSLFLGSDIPVYICEITATGYKNEQFNTNQLFRRASAGDSPDGQISVTVDSEQVTLNIYDFVVTLEHK
jgi:hypothetical protein